MTNITPFPWKVGGPWPGITICYIDEHGDWQPIVEVWNYKNGEAPDEVKANARLMAAAPQLLEACKDSLLWFAVLPNEARTIEFLDRIVVDLETAIHAAEEV